MSHNMQQQEGGMPTINMDDLFNPDLFRPRKLTCFKDVVLEVMKLQKFQKFVVPTMVPLIRRIVKEQLQLAMRNQTNMQKNSDEEMQPADPRSLQLRFLNTISQPLFSEAPIQAKDDTKILKLALIDASTEQIISSGPISSSKVEIVVLDGDFNDDLGENWTHEKFSSNIVRERKRKRPLLDGNIVLNLEGGVGLLGDISITDNSSWIRSGAFRLGARILNNRNKIRVREAKTDPFVVKDHRGELNQKHYPPALNDEVWRLKKIGKGGRFQARMSEKGIETVKDFLILLNQDPAHLRNVLGESMKDSMWEVTVKHARTCALDKRVNVYRPRSDENSGVVFNAVGQVTGLLRDGRYILVDVLSEAEKADARNLVTLAFKHPEEVLTLDDETSLHVESSNSAMAGSSDGMKILSSDNDGLDYSQLYASTTNVLSPIIPTGNNNNVDNLQLCDIEFSDADIQFFGMHAGLPSAVGEFMQDCMMEPVEINKANLRWRKIFCVIRWLTVRRNVARKAMLHKQAFQTGETLAFKHREEVLALDETSLHVESSNSAMAGSSNGMNISTSDNNKLDYSQLYASTTDVLSPVNPTGNKNNMDNLELCDLEFIDEDIQFFGMHTGLPSAADEFVQDCLMEPVEINKANLRWRKIFCVIRWLTVRRNVARKAMLHKQAFQTGETLAFKHREEVLALDETSLHVESSNSAMAGSSNGMNISTSDNNRLDYSQLYASTTDVLSPINPTGNKNNMDNLELCDLEFIDEDIQFFGMHTGLPSAANEFVQDCLMEPVEINKANLRWRKIFCVIRWLTVRRNVARKAMLHKQASQTGE